MKFSNNGNIIYGVTIETETDDGEKYDSAFKTFDSHDYSSIATIGKKLSAPITLQLFKLHYALLLKSVLS